MNNNINKIKILLIIFALTINIKANFNIKDWNKIKKINIKNIELYNKLGNILYTKNISFEHEDTSLIEKWNSSKNYKIGTIVRVEKKDKIGIFINKIKTKKAPSFKADNHWYLIETMDKNGNFIKNKNKIEYWNHSKYYKSSDVVKINILNKDYCFRAKSFTNEKPILLVDEDSGDYEIEKHNTSWIIDENACSDLFYDENSGVAGFSEIEVLSPKVKNRLPKDTPIISPFIIKNMAETERLSPPVLTKVYYDYLPYAGYKFLKEVSDSDWNWIFPLRSGKYNVDGEFKNNEPFAYNDDSLDDFNIINFKKAVIIYNSWAKKHDYKEFLNEGTKKQQALEFSIFIAQISRKTSGSWKNAYSPWKTFDYEIGDIWQGGLYLLEEEGYSTDEHGVSKNINYIDKSSGFLTVANRSYHGRGASHLKWNYNYGAFSHWLYDNSLMMNVVTKRDTLLKRPDYLIMNPVLSFLSAIWVWMTPKGVKPSSHDVLYGDVYNISTKSDELGLPPRNDNISPIIAQGDSNNTDVLAYRIGTIINIANGSLECNKASEWHKGPLQTVSYFNAYILYFNKLIDNLNLNGVPRATNIWDDSVESDSNDQLKSITCYNQKSYYSW